MLTVDMAACSNDCTYESQFATYLSLREQNWKQLNKDLNAAASQVEKEKVFREYLANGKTGNFIARECNEKLVASCYEDIVVLSNLANTHGCKHILDGYNQLEIDKMQPGSGLRMQPLDKIMCANCSTKFGSQMCQREHFPAHIFDCMLWYTKKAWPKGSKYDTTAEDASAEPQIVNRRFQSKAIRFPSSATSLPTPCSACLAESGDLSDMVHTILSVPDGYEGEITLHLNHASSNVAFRNLLSLLAMGTLAELSFDMLIQLCYSVAITSEQMMIIIKMLGKLVQDSEGKVVKGPYCASLPQLYHKSSSQ
ncbi:hypothetical protein EMCRGX_G021331 [Ephydatia muelleri]